jgi:branched-chain amino acid transport system substrate-binding protein
MKKSIWVLSVVFLLACAHLSNAAEAPFKVGLISALTGKTSYAGVHMKIGAQLALDEINKAGGINGHPIELIIENDDSQGSKSASAAYKLIHQDKVMLIMGPTTSEGNFATQKITEENEIVQLATSGSSPRLTSEGQKWFFRLALSTAYQMTKMADYLVHALNMNKIGLMTQQEEMAKGAETTLLADLKKMNITPVIQEKFQATDVDFAAQLIRIKNANPQAVALLGDSPKCAQIAQQAKSLGLNVQFFGGTTLGAGDFIQLGGKAVEGTIVSVGFNEESPNPKIHELNKKVREKSSEKAAYHTTAQTYDALYILQKYLKDSKLSFNYNDDKSLARDREAIKTALTQVKGYDGVSGTVSFGPNATPEDRDGIKDTILLQVREGKFVQIWPAEKK